MHIVETHKESLEVMSQKKELPKKQRAMLTKIVEAYKEVDRLNRRAGATVKSKNKSEHIVARLRDTMKSVPQMSGNVKKVDRKVNEILGRIMDLETRIELLQSNAGVLRLKAKNKQKSVQKLLETFKRVK